MYIGIILTWDKDAAPNFPTGFSRKPLAVINKEIMRQIIRLFFLSFLILNSCGSYNKENDKNNFNMIKSKRDVFNKRDENKQNFIFLNYWLGMTKNEYQVITDSLINEKLLENSTNNVTFNLQIVTGVSNVSSYRAVETCNNTFKLEPDFATNKLIGLNLVNIVNLQENYVFQCNNEILELYSKKYGKYFIEKPEKESFITLGVKNNYITLKVENDFKSNDVHTYYNFIQYIWEREKYFITITENYSIINISKIRGSEALISSYVISYTLKANFKSRLYKDILEMDSIKKEKSKKMKESIDKI